MKVVIMKGLPGSGKSYFCKKNYPSATICSADHYFMKNGKYEFNPAELPNAHAACLRRFIFSLMFPESDVVVVDNTNTAAHEIAPYYAIANAFKCEVQIVRVNCAIETCIARNKHDVPVNVIEKMAERINDPIPPYWNEVTSENVS